MFVLEKVFTAMAMPFDPQPPHHFEFEGVGALIFKTHICCFVTEASIQDDVRLEELLKMTSKIDSVFVGRMRDQKVSVWMHSHGEDDETGLLMGVVQSLITFLKQ